MLLLILAAQVLASVPPLSPEEAVRVLRASHSTADRTDVTSIQAHGPTVVVIPSSPTAGPFGEFKPFPPSLPLNCCSIYVTYLGRPLSNLGAVPAAPRKKH